MKIIVAMISRVNEVVVLLLCNITNILIIIKVHIKLRLW